MRLSIVPLHVPFDVLNTDAGDERMAQNDLWIRLRGEPDTMETGRCSLSRSELSFVHIPSLLMLHLRAACWPRANGFLQREEPG